MAELVHIYGFLFRILSRIFWSLDFIRSKIQAAFYPKSADQPRKLRILARDTVSHVSITTTNLNNFIVWSETSVDKDYILKPEVSIYTFTSTHAVFTELPQEHSSQIYNVKKHALMYIPQYDYSQSLIFVPLNTFYDVAESIGDPKYPFLYLHSHGRCGSTLVSNIFNIVPNCLSISEPDSLSDILTLYYYKHSITEEQKKLMVKNTIRYLLRGTGYEFAFIKTRSWCSILMRDVIEAFPSNPVPVIYMYRNGLDFTRSWNKMCGKQTTWDFMNIPKELLLCPPGTIEDAYCYALYMEEYWKKLPSCLQVFLHWVIVNSMYMNFFSGFPEHARSLSYDLLIANPEKVVEDLLVTCGLSKEYLPLALKAMSHDSQEGTVLSTRSKGIKKEVFSEDDMVKVEELLQNIPCLSSDPAAILPGDISGDSRSTKK